MKNTTPTAIPTLFCGYKFRSRLEARWAKFFKTLDIPFQYEPEGFVIFGKPYLPDFFLPSVGGGTWLEIKPSSQENLEGSIEPFDSWAHCKENQDYEEKMRPLVELFGTLILIVGEPRVNKHPSDPLLDEDDMGYEGFQIIPFWDNYYWWCQCPHCHTVGMEYSGFHQRLCTCFDGHKGHNGIDTPLLRRAYSSAMSFDFNK